MKVELPLWAQEGKEKHESGFRYANDILYLNLCVRYTHVFITKNL